VIAVKVQFKTKAVKKMLRDVKKKDILAAKRSAFARAGSTAVSQASKKIAAGAKVPLWMVAGTGVMQDSGKRKKKGARLSRTKYVKKMDGILVYFRHKHINPLGTRHKQRKPRVTKRGVKVGKQLYPDSYVENYGYSSAIYAQGRGGGRLQKIELGQWAENTFRNTASRVVPKVFVKRFEHELNRRLVRRGAR